MHELRNRSLGNNGFFHGQGNKSEQRTEGNKELLSSQPFPSVNLTIDRIWRSFQMCFDYTFNCNQFYGRLQNLMAKGGK